MNDTILPFQGPQNFNFNAMFEIAKKAIGNPEKAKRVLLHRLRSQLDKNTEFKKVVVIGRARTGSNLLLSYMNSHPNLHMEGEIFAFQKQRPTQAILDRVHKIQPKNVQAAGFKLFYHHPMDNKDSDIWRRLKEDKGIHIIQLRRENMLRTHISRKIAMRSDVWTASTNKQVNQIGRKSVSFSKSELELGFNKTKTWEANAQKDFYEHPFIQISYERMVATPETELNRLTRFLGVDDFPLETHLKKQNPEKLEDLVENYAQLKKDFKDTEWQDFFE